MMRKFLPKQSASNVYLNVFDGNPLEVNYFMSIFEEMVKLLIQEADLHDLSTMLKRKPKN